MELTLMECSIVHISQGVININTCIINHEIREKQLRKTTQVEQ